MADPFKKFLSSPGDSAQSSPQPQAKPSEPKPPPLLDTSLKPIGPELEPSPEEQVSGLPDQMIRRSPISSVFTPDEIINVDKARAAGALEISRKLGMDPDVAYDNYENLIDLVRSTDDVEALRNSEPVTQAYLSKGPTLRAALLGERQALEGLSSTEKITRAWGKSYDDMQNNLALYRKIKRFREIKQELASDSEHLDKAASQAPVLLGSDFFVGKVSDSEGSKRDKLLKELDAVRRDLTTIKSGTRWKSFTGTKGSLAAYVGEAVASQIPLMSETMLSLDTLTNTLVAGVAGALSGGPKAGVLTASWAWKVSAAIKAGEIEGNLAYSELMELKDENGMPLPDDVINTAANIVSLINGSLEIASLSALAKTGKGLGGFAGKGLTKAFKNPAMVAAIGRFAKKFPFMAKKGGAIQKAVSKEATELVKDGAFNRLKTIGLASGSEYGVEVFQKLTTDIVKAFLETSYSGDVVQRAKLRESPAEVVLNAVVNNYGGLGHMVSAYNEEGMAAAVGSGVIGTVTTAASIALSKTAQSAKSRAVAQRDAIEQVIDKASESGAAQKAPEALSEIIANTVEEYGDETQKMHVDAKKLLGVFDSREKDIKPFLSMVGLSESKLREAAESDHEVSMPLGKAIAHLAAIDSDMAKEVNSQSRITEDLTAEEMEQKSDKIDAKTEKLFEEESKTSRTNTKHMKEIALDVSSKIGRSIEGDKSKSFGETIAHMASSMARRAGISAKELYSSANLEIGIVKIEEQTDSGKKISGSLVTVEDSKGNVRYRIQVAKDSNVHLAVMSHEVLHYGLALARNALKMAKPESTIAAELKPLTDWLGSAYDGDVVKAEEALVVGFQRALAQGKMPSAELLGPLAKIATWFAGSEAIGYNATAEVSSGSFDIETLPEHTRESMARLFASTRELEILSANNEILDIFSEDVLPVEKFVLDEKLKQSLEESRAAVKQEAAEAIVKQVIDKQREAKSKANKEAKKELVETEKQRLRETTDYRAAHILITGLDPSTESKSRKKVKLSRKATEKLVPGSTQKMPPRMFSKNGFSPEALWNQELFNGPEDARRDDAFQSAEDFVTRLSNLENIDQRAEKNVETALDEATPLLLDNEAEIVSGVKTAYYNRSLAKHIYTQMKALLGIDSNSVEQDEIFVVNAALPSLKMIRAKAEEIVSRKTRSEMNADLHKVAYERHMAEATKLAKEQRLPEAFDTMLRALLNLELFMSTEKAQKNIDKMYEYQSRFDRPTVMRAVQRAGAHHRDAIVEVRRRLGFVERSDLEMMQTEQEAARRDAARQEKSLSEYANELKALGVSFFGDFITAKLDGQQAWEALPYRQLKGAIDSLKTVEYLAKKDMSSKDLAEKISEATRAIPGFFFKQALAQSEKSIPRKALESLSALVMKVATLAPAIDGGVRGLATKVLVDDISKATNNKTKMSREYVAKIKKLFGAYTAKERRGLGSDSVAIESLDGMEMTRFERISAVLNVGTLSGRETLMSAMEWDQDVINELVSSITLEADWKFIQGVWGIFRELSPQVQTLGVKLTGVRPAMIPGIKISTPVGVVQGGYYPVIQKAMTEGQKAERVQDGATVDEDGVVDAMSLGSYQAAMTLPGYLHGRYALGMGTELDLDMSRVSKLVLGIVHDVTMLPAVSEAIRMTHNSEFVSMVDERFGTQSSKMMRKWATDIKRQYSVVGDESPVEKVFGFLRRTYTTGALMFRWTSAVSQISGLVPLAVRLGPKGTMRMFRNLSPDRMIKDWKWINEHAPQVSNASFFYDQEQMERFFVRAARQGGANGALGWASDRSSDLMSAGMFAISTMQRMVSTVGFRAAYDQAMLGEATNEGVIGGNHEAALRYAEAVVADTQGTGDLTRTIGLQRSHEMLKLLTMFATPFLATMNSMLSAVHRKKLGKDGFLKVSGMVLGYGMVMFMADGILRGEAPDLDDDWKKNYAKWAAANAVGSIASGVPVARDIFSYVESLMKDKGWHRLQISPLQSRFEDVGNAISGIYRDVTDDSYKWTTGKKKALGRTIGTFTPFFNSVFVDLMVGLEEKLSKGEPIFQ